MNGFGMLFITLDAAEPEKLHGRTKKISAMLSSGLPGLGMAEMCMVLISREKGSRGRYRGISG